MSRILRNFLVTTALTAILAACVSAAPIPLLEMKWQQGDFENGSIPATVEFSFGAGDGFGLNYLGWVANYSRSNVEVSFWSPMAVVEGANVALSDLNASYNLRNGPGNSVGPFQLELDQEPTSDPPCPLPGQCFGVAIYVDDVPSYRVTSVERVINYLELTDFFGNWTISASQSIRYWGEPIPEPGGPVLLTMAVLHMCISFRPR